MNKGPITKCQNFRGFKIAISVEKRRRFKENHSSSSSHQTRKKKHTPLSSSTVTITPAITTVGRLIIWRRSHGIGHEPGRKRREKQKHREESIGQPTHEHQLCLHDTSPLPLKQHIRKEIQPNRHADRRRRKKSEDRNQ